MFRLPSCEIPQLIALSCTTFPAFERLLTVAESRFSRIARAQKNGDDSTTLKREGEDMKDPFKAFHLPLRDSDPTGRAYLI